MRKFAFAFGITRSNKKVPLEMFAKVCTAFGPLGDFNNFIARIQVEEERERERETHTHTERERERDCNNQQRERGERRI